MALVAIIAEPGETMHLAGYTWERFHGLNSTFDTGRTIVDYAWNFADGSPVLYGPIASHRFDTAGTYNVQLTVTDDLGATNSTTFQVVVSNWNPAWGTIYVASSGNDSTGNGSQNAPYQTPLKAFQVAFNGVGGLYPPRVTGQPKKILLNRGDTFTYSNNGGNGDTGVFTHPMIGDTYGSGANPIISISEGVSLYQGNNGHFTDNWGESILIKNWEFRWPTPGQGWVGATAFGSTFDGCKQVNGTFEATDGNVASKKVTWANCEATGHLGIPGGGGMGFSNGGGRISWYGVINANCYNNSPGRATNAYFHGDLLEIRGGTYDGFSNGVQSALLLSGCQKYMLYGCTFKNANEGAGVGSNGSVDGSSEAQDLWMEACYFQNCTGDGMTAYYVNRGVIKNNVFENCLYGIQLGFSNQNFPTERTQNVGVYGNTVYASGNGGIYTNGVRTIQIRNNIVFRTSDVDVADKKFVQLGFGAQGSSDDYLYVNCNRNFYYSNSGDSTSTNGAFSFNNGNKTFVQWQTAGFDPLGLFQSNNTGTDPIFTNSAGHDFSLVSGSAAKNIGGSLPMLYRDYLGYIRSTADATLDAGAFEQGATPPATDLTPPTVSLTSPVDEATVSELVLVAADAADNVAVVGVQFKLDGNNLGAEVLVAPYTVSWDTTTALNGAHALTATARDAAGNTTTSTTVNVTVENDVALVQNFFQKEFDKISAPTAGTTTYVLGAMAQGAVLHVEFENDAATQPSCTLDIVWSAQDGDCPDLTTWRDTKLCKNLDIRSDTSETNYRHGTEMIFPTTGAQSLRVDVRTMSGTGKLSLWVSSI